MKLSDGSKFSNRTKHVDTKFHFIRDLKLKNCINLEYVSSDMNVADLLTKPLGTVKISQLRYRCNVI